MYGRRPSFIAPGSAPDPAQDPPAWLSDAARVIWCETIAVMVRDGLWRQRYRDALATYCALFAEFQRDPAAATANMVTQIRLLQSSLGLNPASERGLTPAKPAPDWNTFPPKPAPAGPTLRRTRDGE